MSAKKPKIQKIEAPTTNNRVEQLRYLAKLRGEYEEEAPKLNTKRFLIISAIIVVILVAGLIFTNTKVNEISAYNEEVDSINRLAEEAASAQAEELELNARTDAKMSEVNTLAKDTRKQISAEKNVKDSGEDVLQVEDHSQPVRIIRLILLFFLIAGAVVFYVFYSRDPKLRADRHKLILCAAILLLLLIAVLVLGAVADNMAPKPQAVEETAAESDTAGDEAAASTAAAATATAAVSTTREIDNSVSTWVLARLIVIVLLVVYGVFMLVKLAHPKRRKPNRSFWGDFGIYFMMAIFAVAMVFPLVFSIAASLKPLDELFRFPPTVFAQHPTMDNFADLFVTMGQSYVPFSRYLTNTVFITFVGTFGHVLIASMAAFVLAKYDFPGGRTFFSIVVTALMFSGYVTGIPNYVIMSRLGMINTYWAIILPAFAAPIGLFLMKQFMEGLPTALIEAAHLDGAGEFRIFWSIVMPNVKPAWLTIIIFSVQGLWNTNAATVIYTESKKTLVYALQQIQLGGIARTGQAAAVTVIVMIVPIVIFILSQSRILETMASSGLKD